MRKKNYFFILSLTFLSLLNITTFANNISLDTISLQSTNSINDTLTKEIYLKYSNASKIEFIANDADLYYFRIFEQKGDMNYKVIEYNTNSLEMKELIWIWSKNYDSDIRTIQLEPSEIDNASAKVYLRDGKIIDEKIRFIDPLNSFEFVEWDTSIQDVPIAKVN